MANIVEYTRNVAKSISYAAIDKVKEMNPVLTEIVDDNKALTQAVYASVKDYRGTAKKAKDWIIKSPVYEAADVGLHAVVEDIRSGKFYNRERQDEMDKRAAGSLMEGYDFDDPFAEIDGDSSGSSDMDIDFDDDSSFNLADTADVIDSTGEKITNGVAMATARSAEGISSTNIQIAQRNQKHNEFLTNKLNAGLASVNSTIGELINFNNKVQKPFIDTSISFYNNIQKAHDETNNLLKQIIANQEKMISPPDKEKEREKLGWNEIGEIPNLQTYAKRIVKNMKDQSMGMGDMFSTMTEAGFGNTLLSFVASPLEFIPKFIVNQLIPKTMEEASTALNDTLSGLFGGLVSKFNKWAKDDEGGLKSIIGKLLGIQDAETDKTSLRVQGIGKKAIAWDEQSKHALTRVIPDTLAKILAAQTKTAESIFDYNSGKYVSTAELAAQYDPEKLMKEAAASALSEFTAPLKELVEGIDFGYDNGEKYDKLMEAIDTMARNMYQENRTIRPEKVAQLSADPNTRGKVAQELLLDGFDNPDAVNILAGLISGLGSKDNKGNSISAQFTRAVRNANKNILNQKNSVRNIMTELEKDPTAALMNLYNGFDGNSSFVMKDGKYTIKTKEDKYGKNFKEYTALNPKKDIDLSKLAWQRDTVTLLNDIKGILIDYETYFNRIGTGGGGGVSNSPSIIGVDGSPITSNNTTFTSIRGTLSGNMSRPSALASSEYEVGRLEHSNSSTNDSTQRTRERRSDQLKRRAEKGQIVGNWEYLDLASDAAGNAFNAAADIDEDRMRFNRAQGFAYARGAQRRNDERRLNEVREKQKREQSFMSQVFGIKDQDSQMFTFLNGLKELSTKPAEFMVNMIHKVDDRLYQIVFGDENDDKLNPKSFMNQLVTRMGFVFRDFKGFLNDEIFSPLKQTLFGEDGFLSNAKDKMFEALNIDEGEMTDAMKKFIFGEVDEDGNRHGGMFGDKINWTKTSLKDAKRELGDLLVQEPDGGWKINEEAYNKYVMGELNNDKDAAKKFKTINKNVLGKGSKENVEAIEALLGGEGIYKEYKSDQAYIDMLESVRGNGKYSALSKEEIENIAIRDYVAKRLGIHTQEQLDDIFKDLDKKTSKWQGSKDDPRYEQFYNEFIEEQSKGVQADKSRLADLQSFMDIHKFNEERARKDSADSADEKFALMRKYGMFSSQEDIEKAGLQNAADRAGFGEVYDYKKHDGVTNHAAGGGIVSKTGLVALSEGEIVIPNKYNPFYKGRTDFAYNNAKEQRAIDKYYKQGEQYLAKAKIPQFANGTGPEGYRGPGAGEIELQPRENFRETGVSHVMSETGNRARSYISNFRKAQGRKRRYGKLTKSQKAIIDSFGYDRNYDQLDDAEKEMYDNGYFIQLLESLGELEEGIAVAAEDMDPKKYEDNKSKLFNGVLNDLKENIGAYFPSMLGSSLLGAGVSLVTGAVGGPLLGAAVGAGADLVVHSGKIQDWLFGERDDEGKRQGNILSADLANNIEKYLPSMAKGATVGAITSILPFVPGGPVAGVIMGSAIGFAKKNDSIQRMLFGYEDEDGNYNKGLLPKDFKQKLQGVVPDAILGALGGAAGTLIFGGPFGLVGNMALGGALGIFASTEKFQDALFGEKNPTTGIREGGLFGAIKTGFIEPLIDTGKSLKDKFTDWFKKDIANPIKRAIAPLAKQGGLIVGGVIGGITGGINKIIEKQIGDKWSGMGHLFKEMSSKVLGAATTAAGMVTRPIAGTLSSPFRMIGRVGDHFQKRHVAEGNADYMTAKQRMQYRQELDDNVYYKKYTKNEYDKDGKLIHVKGDVMTDELGRPIKEDNRRFRYLHNTLGRGKMKKHGKHKDVMETYDNMLMNMDKDELKELSDSLDYLKDPDKVTQRQRNEAIDKINKTAHTKYGLSYRESQKVLDTLREKGLNKAISAVEKLNLDSESAKGFINTLTQQYSVVQATEESTETQNAKRQALYKKLDKMGLKGINDSNLDKYATYAKNEYELKKQMNPVDKLNEDQEKRHNVIVDLLKDLRDELQIIRNPKNKEKILNDKLKRNKRISESGSLGANNILGDITNRFHNNNALWGKEYELKSELTEDGYKFFMEHKETGERYEVDSEGNRLDGKEIPSKAGKYTKNRGIHKLRDVKSAVKNLDMVRYGWSKKARKGHISYQEHRDEVNANKKEKKDNKFYKTMCIRYLQEKMDNFGGTGAKVSKKDAENYLKEKMESYVKEGQIKSINDYAGAYSILVEDDLDNTSENFRNTHYSKKIDDLGLKSKRLRKIFTGGARAKDKNGKELNAEYYYKSKGWDKKAPNLDGEGKVIGEETDILGKSRSVFDLFGNPIKLKKDSDGRWIKDPSDSDNKFADAMHSRLTNIGDTFKSGLTGLGTDLKEGIFHLFKVDEEKDGWLKKLVKIGGGVLGALTAVSAIPWAQAWWDNSIKPFIKEWYTVNILPKVQEFIAPVVPTIAKVAVGIDMAIRSIPTAIDNLGNRIQGFITQDLPKIWSEKILPFYQGGFEWIENAVSYLSENILQGAVKILPRIISGAIKGASKFLTKDIFSIIAGYGRRDAAGIFSESHKFPTTTSITGSVSNASKKMSSFDGFSRIASTLTGTSISPDGSSTSNVSQSDLESYYSGDNNKYPVGSTSEYVTNYSTDTQSGYDNPFGKESGSLESNKEDMDNLEAYSTGVAMQGYSAPTNTASAKAYDEAAKNNDSLSDKITSATDKTVNSVNNSTVNKITTTKKTITKKSGYKGTTKDTSNPVTEYNGYQYYDTTNMFNAGSSAGITLYNAGVDDATGLIYSESGKFIPNAFYDPATGSVTNTPTAECLAQYPNIQSDHDTMLYSALSSGDLSYEDYYGYALEGEDTIDYGDGSTFSAVMANLGVAKDNFGTAMGDQYSIGARFFGANSLAEGSPKGLARVALTGNAGLIGKGLNKFANSKWSKSMLGKAIQAPGKLMAKGGAALTNTAERFSVGGLSRSHIAKRGDIVADIINMDGTKYGGTLAERYEWVSKGLKEGTLSKDQIDTYAKGLSEQFTGNIDNFAKESIGNTKLSSAVSSAVENTADDVIKNGDGIIKNFSKNFKSKFKELIDNKHVSKIIGQISGEGSEKIFKEALENSVDDIAEVVAKKTAKGVFNKVAYMVPYLNIALAVIDFLKGWNDSAEYLGLSTKQFNELMPGIGGLGMRFLMGLANALNNAFLLGIVPMSTIVDIFVNAVAPVLGINTEALQEAREKTAKELEKFKKETGQEDKDITVEDMNNYNGWFGKLKRALGIEEDLKEEASKKNSLKESKKASKALDAVKNGEIKYDSTKTAANNSTSLLSTESRLGNSDYFQKYIGKGSGLDLNSIYVGNGKNIYLDNTYSDMYNTAHFTINNTMNRGPINNPAITHITGSGSSMYAGRGSQVLSPVYRSNYYSANNTISSGYSGRGIAPITHKYSSISNMATLGKAIETANINKGGYSGRGSGIAGRGSGIIAPVYIGGGTTAYRKNAMMNMAGKAAETSGSSNIINETAKIIMKVETNGNTNHIAVDNNGKYSIGCACWNGPNAASLLKAIIKEDSTNTKKVTGEKLFKKIKSAKDFTKKTYTKTELEKIKLLLGTEESRRVQAERLGSDIKGYIADVSKKYDRAKVIMFVCVLRHQYGASGYKQHLPKDARKREHLQRFFQLFKETKAYKTYQNRYDTAYNMAIESQCNSVNLDSFSSGALLMEMGVSESTETSSSTGNSSGGWLSELTNLISDMGNALFGIETSSGSESSNNVDESSIGEEQDSMEDVLKNVTEKVNKLFDKINSEEYTLLQRLEFLSDAYNKDHDLTIQLYRDSTLLTYLLASEVYRKKVQKDNVDFLVEAEVQNYITSVGGTINSAAEAQELSRIRSSKETKSATNYSSADFTNMIANGQIAINDRVIEKTIKNTTKLAQQVQTEFSTLADNSYAILSLDDFKVAFEAFINTYIANNDCAKKIYFYKILKANKDVFKQIKSKWNNRLDEISYLRNYLNSNLETDYKNELYFTEKDKQLRALDTSFVTLADSESELEEKEAAWDIATGVMSKMLGFGDNPLTTVKNDNTDKEDEYIKSIKQHSNSIPEDVYSKIVNNNSTGSTTYDKEISEGVNLFSKRFKSKKYKSARGIIKGMLKAYPEVTDFNTVLNPKTRSDILGIWSNKAIENSKSTGKSIERSMAEIINNNGDQIKQIGYDENLNSARQTVSEITKTETYTTNNIFNPYTIKRLLLENDFDKLEQTDVGKKYAAISKGLIDNYIYDHKMTDGLGEFSDTGNLIKEADLSDINITDPINGDDYNYISGFGDFFTEYKKKYKDEILAKHKYTSEYLDFSKDNGLIDTLPTDLKDIKIDGQDVDYDNYVYAESLYQNYYHNMDSLVDEVLKSGEYGSSSLDEATIKGTKKLIKEDLEKYLLFEKRKVGALEFDSRYEKEKDDINYIRDIASLVLPLGPKGKKPSYKKINELIEAKFGPTISGETDANIGTFYLAKPGVEEKFGNDLKTIIDNYYKKAFNIVKVDGKNKQAIQSGQIDNQEHIDSLIAKNDKDWFSIDKLKPDHYAKIIDGALYFYSDAKESAITDSIEHYNAKDYGYSDKDLRKVGITSKVIELPAGYSYHYEYSDPAGKGSGLYGRGTTDPGFISQLDYGNMRFSDGESLAEAGCGPAVAAMAINGLSGGASMVQAASLANKYKTTGGTDAAYFKDAFNRAGAKSTYYEGSSAASGATNSLKKGQQVVLLGQDASNKSKEKSPFGPGNHYVLAKGMGNGKIAINDPEQHGTRMYDKSILKNAKLGIAVAGKGSKIINKVEANSYVGGASANDCMHWNLGSWSPVTAKQMNDWIRRKNSSSPFNGKGQYFIDAAKASGLDPRYILAHAAVEAGWMCTSTLAKKHNYFGIAAYDSNPVNNLSSKKYGNSGMREGLINGAVWIRDHYYDKGQRTIYTMRYNNGSHEYCTSNTWVESIANIMASGPKNTKAVKNKKSLARAKQDVGVSGSDGSTSSTSSTNSAGWITDLTTAVSNTVQSMMGQDVGSTGSTSTSGTSSSNSGWVSVVKAVKKAYADNKISYNQSGATKITVNGISFSPRTDCSGLVSACLRVYTNGKFTSQPSSHTYTGDKNFLTKYGFSRHSWSGWDSLVEGDIISRNGHVEIFAYNKNGKHYVYNGGSTRALQSAGATTTGHNEGYTTVWRCDSTSGAGSLIKLSGNGSSITKVMNNVDSKSSRSNDIALDKISRAYRKDSKSNIGSGSNKALNNASKQIKTTYSTGSNNRPTASGAFKKANSSYIGGSSKITMYHPVTGEAMEVSAAAMGSLMEETGYSGGKSTNKTKSSISNSVKKSARVDTKVKVSNLDNTNALLRTMVTILTKINKNASKNKEIAAILNKIYEKSGKGSGLAGGDSDMKPSSKSSTSNAKKINEAKSIAKQANDIMQSHTQDDYDDMNDLLKELLKIAAD